MYGHFPVYSPKGHSSALWHAAPSAGVGWDVPTCWMRPGHGPIRISEHAIPDMVCHVSKADTWEKEDSAPPKDLLYLWFFPLSPIYNPCSPLVYKREGRALH